MKIIINSDNKQRRTWIDLVQVEKSDKGFQFTDGNSSWFEKCEIDKYLVRTQLNTSNSPVFYHNINQTTVQKLLQLSVDDAVELMDNIIHDGENV
jgi:antibiotic biosynthesis monooxygenase (ABM) superfamily enzyme